MKALIIIDMLEGYAQDCFNRDEVVANQLVLVDAFRDRGYPIIIVSADLSAPPNPVMVRLWGVEFADEPEKARLIRELENVERAVYVSKTEYSAFFRTPLESFCEEQGIDELCFCGYASGVCVFFSAVDAAMRRCGASSPYSSPTLRRRTNDPGMRRRASGSRRFSVR
jgi:nicotinamidase/pyrazinamidase